MMNTASIDRAIAALPKTTWGRQYDHQGNAWPTHRAKARAARSNSVIDCETRDCLVRTRHPSRLCIEHRRREAW